MSHFAGSLLINRNILYSPSFCYGIVVAALLLITGWPGAVSAQEAKRDSSRTTSPRSHWISAGLGLTSLGAIAFKLNGNTQISSKYMLTMASQFETNQLPFDDHPRNIDETSYSLLAGRIFKKKNSLFSVSAGLSVVNVLTDDEGNDPAGIQDKKESTIGLPVLVQWYGVGFQFIGVGLNGFVNLNAIHPTAGLTLSVALGRMPDSR